MGLIYTEVNLSNPRNSHLAPLTVTALVDTGAVNLCVPEHVAVQLELAELERREVTTADGKHALVPYVGPVQVTFGNRSCSRAPSCWGMACCWVPSRWQTWTWW